MGPIRSVSAQQAQSGLGRPHSPNLVQVAPLGSRQLNGPNSIRDGQTSPIRFKKAQLARSGLSRLDGLNPFWDSSAGQVPIQVGKAGLTQYGMAKNEPNQVPNGSMGPMRYGRLDKPDLIRVDPTDSI